MRCQCLKDSFATLSVARLGVKKEMFIYRYFVFVYDHLVCSLQESSVFLGLRVNPKKERKNKRFPNEFKTAVKLYVYVSVT